jgi:predicted ATPase
LFPGTFETYVAGIIDHWKKSHHQERLEQLASCLRLLGLTSSIDTQPIGETRVELRVGRVLDSPQGKPDLVNIADVGLGVSQVLPVVVALLAAEPGQLVYIEQPEIHLHPKAQVALAHVLADAARRGVRVVAETHSQLLLLGIQTLVAKGELDPALIKLHWFQRDEEGVTTIASHDVDENGAFGEWPEDFADVSLSAESDFLDAATFRKNAAHGT